MNLDVLTSAGASGGSMTVEDAVFGVDFNEPLIHQVVTAYMAGARQGTKAQKSRAAVRGGGKKPWNQKGSGRARAGSSRSPIWRGGGATFAAQPRNFSQKVNRKMYRGAVRSIVSELIRQERLVVVDAITVDAPKTKQLLSLLNNLNIDKGLLVSEAPDNNLYLSARNVPHVDVCAVDQVTPVELVGFDRIVMTKAAVEKLQERLV
jgi:large subunit ribosomal protein L4